MKVTAENAVPCSQTLPFGFGTSLQVALVRRLHMQTSAHGWGSLRANQMSFEKPLGRKYRNGLQGVSIGAVGKTGVISITIGRNLCEALGLTKDSRVDVLLGTENDTGRVAINPAGGGWALRTSGAALAVRVTAANFNLEPVHGCRPPYEIHRNMLIIDVSAILSNTENRIGAVPDSQKG